MRLAIGLSPGLQSSLLTAVTVGRPQAISVRPKHTSASRQVELSSGCLDILMTRQMGMKEREGWVGTTEHPGWKPQPLYNLTPVVTSISSALPSH